MSWKVIGLTLFTTLGLPLVAAAQGEERATGVVRSPKGQMYEDIEIMRRLLNNKLHGFASPDRFTDLFASQTPRRGATVRLLANSACASCHSNVHDNYLIWSDPYNTGYPHNKIYPNLSDTVDTLEQLGKSYHRNRLVFGHHDLWTTLAMPRSPLAEGTYLKGQGVIFTLTLPPPERDPRPEPLKPAPKPPTEWERIRKEVRQEKPQTQDTAPPAKEPTLSEVILKLLAENGQHFSQLGENESLTVAVTFRTPEPAANGLGAVIVDLDNDGKLDISVTNLVDPAAGQQPQAAKEDKPKSKPATEDTNHKKVKDLTLLGELHLKQGKTEEAIKALRQALELNPEGEQAVSANRLLAQALLAAQKDEDASKAVQKALEWLKKRQEEKGPKPAPAPAPQPKPLPAKLSITAPKKLLDQVASGKISFEEFKKAATVDFITFGAEKK
jgi:hypothetical protein